MKGSLVHFKDDVWHLTIIVGYVTDENGIKKPKRHKYTIHAINENAAEREQAKILTQLDMNEDVRAGKITLGEYADRWLADGKKKDANGDSRWSDGGYTWYERRTRLYIKPELGYMQMSKITKRQIDDFLDKVSSKGAFVPIHCYRSLHALWQQAIYDGDVGVTLNLIDRVKAPEEPNVEHDIWHIDQIQLFLSTVDHYRYHLVYLVAFTTGMRINEVLGLRWRDIDFKESVIKVRKKIERAGLNPAIGKLKTKKSVRIIKMIPKLSDELKKHKTIQAQEKLESEPGVYKDYGPEFADLVFTKTKGGPVNAKYLFDREFVPTIETLQKKKETWVPRIRIHDMRHSAATYLLDIGTPLEVVQEILGHSTPLITKKIYIKDNVKRQEKPMERMSEDFG